MFGLALGRMGRVGALTDAQKIAALFANSEPGAWYDPADLSTLFQDSAFTVPVTAVEQPVGGILDLSGRGNHASMATTTKRPAYSRRVNLFTSSEDFSNAKWGTGGVSVSDNATLAPNGTLTADKIIADAVSSSHQRVRNVNLTAGSSYLMTFRVKIAEVRYVALRFFSGGAWASNYIAYFDLLLGTVKSTFGAGVIPSISSVENGFVEIGLQRIADSTGFGTCGILLSADGIGTTYSGNDADGVYMWGADIRLMSDAHLPYQRVNTSDDYDADPAKFPAYLRFDGVDDALQTGNIDFTSTDKMTVWAGVTTLGVVDQMRIVELGVNATSTAGFGVFGAIATSAQIRGELFGTSRGVVDSPSVGYPSNANVAAQFDIGATSLLDEIKIRRGGIAVANYPIFGGSGTGNFPNSPVFIGARAAVNNYFNGRLYGLIIRGAQSTLSQIEATEAYIKQKMKLP